MHGDPAKGAHIAVETRDKLVAPTSVEVRYADGTIKRIKLAADTWQLGAKGRADPGRGPAITLVAIDPDHRLPNRDRSNNTFSLIPASAARRDAARRFLLKARDAAALKAAQAHVAAVTAAQTKATAAIMAAYTPAVAQIAANASALTKEIPAYVTPKDDAACVINTGAVRLLDDAASGLPALSDAAPGADDAPSGVALSTLVTTDVSNDAAALENADQLAALQAWVRAQQAAWTASTPAPAGAAQSSSGDRP